jgi:transposase
VAEAARLVAHCAREARGDQLGTSGDRFGERPRCFWGDHTGPNPTDRAKSGCKRHLLTDAEGLPLVVRTTPANMRDDAMAETMVLSMRPVQGARGRPRTRPTVLQGDAAYGSSATAVRVRSLGIKPLLAPLGKNRRHGSGLGRTRYVVERTLSWFGNYRRLKLCYERTGAHFQAFHDLAAALICYKRIA